MGSDGGYTHEERLVMLQCLFQVAVGVVGDLGSRIVVVKDVDLVWIVPVPFDVLERWIVVLISVFSNEKVLHAKISRDWWQSELDLLPLSIPVRWSSPQDLCSCHYTACQCSKRDSHHYEAR